MKREFAGECTSVAAASGLPTALAPAERPLGRWHSSIRRRPPPCERDGIFNIKIGANLALAKVKVRPEATFIGEQTFAVSIGTEF